MGLVEGKRPLGRPRRKWKKMLRWILKEWDGAWLSTGAGSGRLWMR